MDTNNKNLTGDEWTQMLLDDPSLADRCDWSKLGPEDWERLLAKRPEFAAFKPKN